MVRELPLWPRLNMCAHGKCGGRDACATFCSPHLKVLCGQLRCAGCIIYHTVMLRGLHPQGRGHLQKMPLSGHRRETTASEWFLIGSVGGQGQARRGCCSCMERPVEDLDAEGVIGRGWALAPARSMPIEWVARSPFCRSSPMCAPPPLCRTP